MTFFDPADPCAIGPEWMPTINGATALNGDLIAAAVVVDSTETETVDAVAIDVSTVSLPSTGQGTGWDVEVYDATDLPSTVVTSTDLRPSEDVRVVDVYAWGSFAPGGTQTNVYRGADSTTLTPGTWPNTGQPVDNDEFLFPIYGTGYEVSFRFGNAVGDYVGKHVTRVGLSARIQEYVDLAFVAGMTITPYLMIGGVRYFGPTFSVNGESPGGHVVEASWYANPATRSAWRAADVDEFSDAGGTSAAGWIVRPTGSANNLATILQGWLTVDDVGTEKRVAIGSLTDPVVGWNEVPVSTLAGVAGWSKVDGDRYLIVARRRAGEGSLTARFLDSGEAAPFSVTGATVDVDAATFVVDGYTAATRTHAVALVVGAGVSVDSQPYAFAGLADEIDVATGSPITQTFTPAYSDTFDTLRALVRIGDDTPTADLTVTIERVSDSVVFATWTIAVDDLVAPATRWQVVDVVDPAATPLVATTAYRFRFATTSTNPWQVQVLESSDAAAPTGLADATWLGTVAAASVSGTLASADVAANAYTTTPAPTGLSAVASSEVDGVAYVTVDATVDAPDCSTVDYVEVQRSDTIDTTWRTVARVAADAFPWDDYEARRNVASTYRARTRRADGGVSDWSATASATPTLTRCGLVLTSNVDPTLTEWFDDVADGVTSFKFLDNVDLRQYLGRPYSVAFVDPVARGIEYDRVLLVGATNGAVTGTPAPSSPTAAWNRVLAIASSEVTSGLALPYVCVLNRDGERHLAQVRAVDATRREPAGSYQVRVTVTELTAVPYAVEVP